MTSSPPVRRLTWLLFFGQSIGAAGFLTSSTIGAILGARFGGHALAGVPGALYLLGNALAAYPAARLMERTGRRPGLSLGFALSVLGAMAAGFSVVTHHFVGFLVGFSLMGAGRGFYDLGRYAAAEMHPAHERARAISLVVFGGTLGSVLGPQLTAPAGLLAERFGQDALAGPWFISAGLFALGALLIALFLRPDPRTLGQQLHDSPESPAALRSPLRPVREIISQRTTQTAVVAMVVGQLVMVMIMAITSVHMTDHGHGLDAVANVLTAHTLGMFGLSLVSGRIADNFGRAPTIIVGGGLLMAAALLAPLSLNAYALMLALFLLGLGWNFCCVAGAALLTDSLTLGERGRWQGGIDFAVAMVSAAGNLLSGLVFDKLGYAAMNWAGLGVTLIPLLFAIWLMQSQAVRVRVNEPQA
jgi:MFS family permease